MLTLTLLLSLCLFVFAANAAARVPAHQQAWQYKWQVWLPDKWQRIGACETGYGKRPGNWKHSNANYQGAFGFAVGSWDQFKLDGYPAEAWQATPWQQYQVALAIWRRYGFTGWGCRNA
jgi:hypothetical protein